MKKNSIDEVLSKQHFNEKEAKAFMNILKRTKLCLEDSNDNLKKYVSDQIDKVVSNEV